MKNKFESVKINDTVLFENSEGNKETGVVTEVKKSLFIVRSMGVYVDNNDVKCFHDTFFTFHKTGTKTHSHYTHGNAIEVNGSIN